MKSERELFLDVANSIKDMGYDVWVAKENGMFFTESTYGYIVKHHHIGYFELGLGGYDFATVHKPNAECGTGFRVAECVETITEKIVDRTFVDAPFWGNNYVERGSVKKYKDFDEYLKLNNHIKVEKL